MAYPAHVGRPDDQNDHQGNPQAEVGVHVSRSVSEMRLWGYVKSDCCLYYLLRFIRCVFVSDFIVECFPRIMWMVSLALIHL